jgi:mono/diheme cytochrome c family protein
MRFLILVLMAATVALGGLNASTSEPQAVNSENGRLVYDDRGCYQCHGYEAQGGPGSRLAPSPLVFEVFSSYVRQPSGQMPP